MYESFLIGNARFGLEEGLSPWLLPQDAWSTLNNGYLRRGILYKRNGYVEFARMIHSVTAESIGWPLTWSQIATAWQSWAERWDGVGITYTGTLSNAPLRIGDLSFTDGVLTLTDDGDGTLSGDGTGTIDYTTGAYSLSFSSAVTGAITASYDYYPDLSISGIEVYSNLTTLESDLMIFNKRRCAKWDPTTSKLEDTCGSDTWTGGDYDYFWGCNARNRLYVTNNVDRVKYWNGSAWANLLMDIDGDAANNVSTCLFIVHYKERLVVFRIAEDGVLHPQRARWCSATDHDDWSNDEYVDAPTNDWIMCADFIGEDLIVWFENSVWRLKYTGDATLPFRWEQINATIGAYARFSGFAYNDVMSAIGSTNILETDNLKVYEIDDKIPDAVTGMALDQFDKIYTIPIQELQQIVMSYPAQGETANSDSILYNYDDKSWARYDYGFNVYGYYLEDSEPTFDDIDETFDEMEVAWDDHSKQAGYPITLGGDVNGYVWKINSGGSDDGAAISFDALSGRWNPYLKEGKKARFGWVEFLVDRDPSIDITVEFYAHDGNKESVVSTQTITCGEGDENADTVWVRADNGSVGDFHRVRLTNNAANETLGVHAMKLAMKRAGNMR